MSIEGTDAAGWAMGTRGKWRAFFGGAWGQGLVLVVLTLAAFSPAITTGGFVWDDDEYLTVNRWVQQPGGLPTIWTDRMALPQYYPAVFTTFWAEYRIWGLFAPGYHAVNVLLHAASAVLVWRILSYLRVRGALVAAALFAVHPVMVESVAWITERKNVLSGVFYLTSLLVYLRWAMDEEGAIVKRRWRGYALALLLYVLALLSKSVACTMPAAVLILLWYRQGRVRWRQVGALVPFVVLGAAMGLNTAYVERVNVGAMGPDWDFTWVERILIAGRAWWFYIGKLLVPVSLNFIYPRWQLDAGAWWQYVFPAAALAAIGGALLLTRRMGRGVAPGVLFFTVTIGPALGFTNVYPMRFSFVADHFQYLASLGILSLLGAGAAMLGDRWKPDLWGKLVVAAVLGVLCVMTAMQCLTYRNRETLWNATLLGNDRAWLAVDNLAALRQRQGHTQEALALLSRSREIKPANHVEVYFNLGTVYASVNRMQEAQAAFEECLRQRGDPYMRAAAANGLGGLAAQRNDPEGALRWFQRSVEIYPRLVIGLDNVAAMELTLGNPREARRAAERALAVDPADQRALNTIELTKNAARP